MIENAISANIVDKAVCKDANPQKQEELCLQVVSYKLVTCLRKPGKNT